MISTTFTTYQALTAARAKVVICARALIEVGPGAAEELKEALQDEASANAAFRAAVAAEKKELARDAAAL
jgi:hypothetical protein